MKCSRLVWCLVLCLQYFCVNSHKFQSTLGHLKPKSTSDVQKTAVENLIKRILPDRNNEFLVLINSSLIDDEKDLFTIQRIDGKVHITGTTGVAAATGFHYYLKYFCNCHISWEASQLNLPKVLPDVNVTISLNDRFRYYQNVCTTSYSFVWWDWNQWEKHIDWMALNSFNLVLAFNGQEAIWQKVYQKLGLTNEDINEHFSGPAFLSWLRMGNLRGWAGPLSDTWHLRSLYLQKKILERLREFGIITILPAFAGHVPRAFKRIYPSINMTMMEVWNAFSDRFCCPYFLDPTQTLFQTVGKMFVEEQIAEYGTDHVYNCDSFNEMDPTNDDLIYLSNVGKSIFSAMKSADPQAIWVLQGWMFYNDAFWSDLTRAKSFLTSVPTGNMIVLDLMSEQFPQYTRLQQYFGQPYIWCMLHNFGGTLGMYGSSTVVNEEVISARNAENSTMIGTGLTMEGINQNYVIYDLMTESAWRKEPTNLTEWFIRYSRRRYGKADSNAENAWLILKDSLYDFSGVERIRGQYVVTKTPSLNIDTWTWYQYSTLFDAWETFLAASDNLRGSPAYLHDLVDLTRQVLQVNGDIYYNKLVVAFRKKNVTDFQQLTTIFTGVFLDLEAILATNKAFLLGPWLEAAKQCANNSEEEKLFEYNARNQITLWGPFGEIMNYAIKQWSGMVEDFLYPRWKLFVTAMNYSLTNGISFDQNVADTVSFLLIEEPFTFSRKVYPMEPIGDAIDVAKQIQGKYWYTNTDIIPEFKHLPMKKRKGLIRNNRRNKKNQECLGPEASVLRVRRFASSLKRDIIGNV